MGLGRGRGPKILIIAAFVSAPNFITATFVVLPSAGLTYSGGGNMLLCERLLPLSAEHVFFRRPAYTRGSAAAAPSGYV
ncbi:hypothetical protein NDU88_007881 [Pleurodeles waltl]|uniref:Uncharacterized protein n=1 Tax=Pleurodeles waltl TaxID=8319 RepID=A0AAV7NW69_PLEWA|nr:hypothetical protein NDU88_007881 [Pleurodeles waltl]